MSTEPKVEDPVTPEAWQLAVDAAACAPGWQPGLDDTEGQLRYAYAQLAEEATRQARIAAGVEHACAGCGCSESRSCEGGCLWATSNLCSRCLYHPPVEEADAIARCDQEIDLAKAQLRGGGYGETRH